MWYYCYTNRKYKYIAAINKYRAKYIYFKYDNELISELSLFYTKKLISTMLHNSCIMSDQRDWWANELSICKYAFIEMKIDEPVTTLDLYINKLKNKSIDDSDDASVISEFYTLYGILNDDRPYVITVVYKGVLKKIKNNPYSHIWRLFQN